MNLVSPLASVLSGLVLFFLTGLVALAWLRRRAALEFDLVEACFFVLATSVMAALWVGLVLAEISRFSLVLAAIAIAIAGTCTWLLRPRVPPAPLQKTTWRSGTAALLVLILAIALQAHPSEYLVGGRDPGTYIAAMAMIARHGTIVYRDPAVLSIPHEDVELFYRHPENPPFSWGRFMGFPLEHPSTGRVFPEFFHAFPVFGAYLFQSLGVKGALATSSVFGILGTLAFFFAVRRICDPFVALIASLLLGMNVLQVWFARYPVSETLSQFLFFTGLWAMAHWEKQRLSGWASLAAIAFGLTLFVRIDSVLILVPLALYWAVRQAGADVSRREALTFALPLILLVTHAALHAVFFSRSYAMSIVSRPYWKASALQWSLLGGLAIVVLGIWWRYGARLLAGAARHADRLAKVFLIVFVGAAIYAFAVRPLLSRHAGADGNNSLQLVLENESCLRFASRPQAQCLAAGTTLRVLAQSAAGILVLDPNTKTWGYLAPEALNASADASLPPHAW
ncbi:MAG: hypothetical protein MUF51_05110, partial [Vicinamibacteria bacterium]|nr:hypothetical protein [Vicinamibacteria bacterium]